MLNTPPDFTPKDLVSSDEGRWENEGKATKELLLSPEPPVGTVEADRERNVVEVAKLAVEVKRLEATAMVEVERLKQHGSTSRVRISEENKTQRSVALCAMVKRTVEEYNQTEREKIAAMAETQQANIAAEVKKAELEAQRPRSIATYWLLLLLYIDRSRRFRSQGHLTGSRLGRSFSMARVAMLFLLLRSFWTSNSTSSSSGALGSCHELWKGLVKFMLRNWQKVPESEATSPRLPLSPLPALCDGRGEIEHANLGHGELRQELEMQGLAEYNQVLQETGYDMDTLRELKEEEEVEEMFRAIQCRPEHRVVFLRLLKSAVS